MQKLRLLTCEVAFSFSPRSLLSWSLKTWQDCSSSNKDDKRHIKVMTGATITLANLQTVLKEPRDISFTDPSVKGGRWEKAFLPFKNMEWIGVNNLTLSNYWAQWWSWPQTRLNVNWDSLFQQKKTSTGGSFHFRSTVKDIEEDDCSSIVDQVDENEGEYKAHFSIKEPNLYLQQNPMKDNCRTQIAFCPHNFPSGEVSKDLVHQKICPSRLFMIFMI